MNEILELKSFAKGQKKKEEIKGGNAIIYTRVSSSEQVDGQSLEVQQDKCREYAQSHSYTVIAEFGGTYESAKSDKERKRKQHKSPIERTLDRQSPKRI